MSTNTKYQGAEGIIAIFYYIMHPGNTLRMIYWQTAKLGGRRNNYSPLFGCINLPIPVFLPEVFPPFWKTLGGLWLSDGQNVDIIN